MRNGLVRWSMLVIALALLTIAAANCTTTLRTADIQPSTSASGAEEARLPLDVQKPISLPAFEPELDFDGFSLSAQFAGSDFVVIGRVVSQIPITMNPPGGPDGPNEALPILYEGYTLKVERWFGRFEPNSSINIYSLADGQFEKDGRLYEIKNDVAATLRPGEYVVVPLEKEENYGVRLGPNEYWMVSSGASAFVLDREGSDLGIGARRASRLVEIAPKGAGIEERETLGSLMSAIGAARLAEKPLR